LAKLTQKKGDRQAGEAPASQDAAHDVDADDYAQHDIGPDDYLDYDPEPYERKLIAAWAGYRFIKPTDEELERALCPFRELSESIEDLLSVKRASLEVENERKSRR
jgi:hypothetical protein